MQLQLTYENKKTIDRKVFTAFLENLGLNINMHTKARGHQGMFLKNRIDVSKMLDDDRKIEVLAHEFAHFIHAKIEPDVARTHGRLEVLFKTPDTKIIEAELYELTLQVDENAALHKLRALKNEIIIQIKEQEKIVKSYYPNFSHSAKFKEFERFIKHSKAKYFMRYDRVKFVTPFLRREEIYVIDNIKRDFATMPEAFIAYIRMVSLKRKRARISRRMNKYNKYYMQPTELFARFIESFFVDKNLASEIAPTACGRFFELLRGNYYFELKHLFEIMNFI